MENNGVVEQTSAEDIARLAYSLWQARGEVPGAPEQDWYRAEELLRTAISHSAGGE